MNNREEGARGAVPAESHPNATDHPVMDALERAIQDRLSRMGEMLKNPPENQPLEEVERFAKQISQLAREYKELVDLRTSALESLPVEERERLATSAAEAYVRAGATFSEGTELIKRATKRPRGRPATQRLSAIKALELRITNPKMSWAILAKNFCDCGQTKHNEACRERIRVGVRELSARLERLGVGPLVGGAVSAAEVATGAKS